MIQAEFLNLFFFFSWQDQYSENIKYDEVS